MFGHSTSPRFRALFAGTLSAGLVFGLAACGGDDSEGGGSTDASASAIDCAPYTSFGDLKGKTVTIYTGIVTPEDTPHKESYKPFESCTGATIKYEGDKSFETQILVRARAGNPPDIAIVPQPGLLQQLVSTGKVVEAPADVAANVDKFWGEDWKGYGTVGGKFYAAPLGANFKSLVWYSPSEF